MWSLGFPANGLARHLEHGRHNWTATRWMLSRSSRVPVRAERKLGLTFAESPSSLSMHGSSEGLGLQPGHGYCHLFRSVNDLRLAIVSAGQRRKSG